MQSLSCAGYGSGSTTEPIIRTLATIVISLLIALALGTVLYALVLAIGRDELPAAEARFTMPPMPALPTPERLGKVPGIEINKMPRSQPEPGDRCVVPIQVLNLASLANLEDAGVATFHTATGSDFRWLPLREAMQGNRDSALVTGEAAIGSRITITLARRREHARHGYIARRDVDVISTDGRSTAIVDLSGTTHEVRFNLPTEVVRAGPLRLQRVDDRQWLPMQHHTSGLTLRRGQQSSLQLGPGDYELQDPLTPDQTQRFSVPETTVVEVSERLVPKDPGPRKTTPQPTPEAGGRL